MDKKSLKKRTSVVCVIGLALLIFSFGLLIVFGLSASVAREADHGNAKIESIEDLMMLLRAEEKERSSTWMKENNERIVRFMADTLREFVDGEDYTGPCRIGEGVVIEIRGEEVLYPEDMEEGYLYLFPSQIDRMKQMPPDETFLGFLTEAEEDSEKNKNWQRLDTTEKEEEGILAALFCAKITDRFYFLDRTSAQELYDYIDMQVGYDDSLQAAEKAYGGAILNIDMDDLHLNSESYYFPGIRQADEIGLTRERIDACTPDILIDGIRYQCSYGSYSPTEKLIYLHPIDDLTQQGIGDALVLCAVMFLFLIQTVWYLVSVTRLVQDTPTSEPDRVRLYAPDRLRRKLLAGGIFGVILVFLIAVLVQSLGMLYNESVLNRTAVNTLVQQLREKELKTREAVIGEEEEWYLYYGSQFATLLSQRPELGRKEKLQEFSDMMGIEYVMLFDQEGNETACNRDYYNFSMGTTEGSYLHEFRRLLMGIPGVRGDITQDEITGQVQQLIGVPIPNREGNPGALLMALSPQLTGRTLGESDLDSHLLLLTAKGTLCLVVEQDGTIVEASTSGYVGNTVMQYGLPEASLRDGYMSFLSLEGSQYYVVTATQDAEVHYYLTEVSSLFGKSALYGLLAAAEYAVVFLVVFAGLMSGYRKVFPSWLQEELEQEKNTPQRITSDHERAYPDSTPSRRWSSIFFNWKNLSPEDRAREIFSLGLYLLLLICIVTEFSANRVSLLRYIITGDWMRGFNLFSLCAVLIVLLLAFMVSYLLRQLLLFVTLFQSGRAETICRLIYSFAAYVLVFVTMYFCFTYMGFPTGAVLASASLTTLALTLGAQGIVADILSGVAIVFEGDFQVGDIVELEGFWGRVEEIGIRTTKIVNRINDVKIIENSQIRNLINKTKYYSVCWVCINVSATESLKRIEDLLAEKLPLIKEKNDKIIFGPKYLGVSKARDRTVIPYKPSMELLIIAECKEEDNMSLTRELNRELILLFEQEGIELI